MSPGSLIKDVKWRIEQKLGTPSKVQRLRCQGRPVRDTQALDQLTNMDGDLTLLLFHGNLRGGAPPSDTENNGQKGSRAATAADVLPPWHNSNIKESQPVAGSVYEDLLNKSQESLSKNLQLDLILPHLKELGVISEAKEEEIKHGSKRQERVRILLDLISHGPRWWYHGFMRSIAKCGQADLIPKSGIDLSVYLGYEDDMKTQRGESLKDRQKPLKTTLATKPALAAKPTVKPKPTLKPKPPSKPKSSKQPIAMQQLGTQELPVTHANKYPMDAVKPTPILKSNVSPTQTPLPEVEIPKPDLGSQKPQPSVSAAALITSKPIKTSVPPKSTLLATSASSKTPAPSKTSSLSKTSTPSKTSAPSKTSELPKTLAPSTASVRTSQPAASSILTPRSSAPEATLAKGPALASEKNFASSTLPVWDKYRNNLVELVDGTEYEEILIQSAPMLMENLRLNDLWEHLEQLHVLKRRDIERIQYNRAEPDQVFELLRFIRQGEQWQYHALLRAMVLTGQEHLVPEGGMDPTVYSEGLLQHETQAAKGISVTPSIHPWESKNLNESTPVYGSIYAELLKKCRVDLYNNLQLSLIWPHLRQLGVLRKTDEERIKATAGGRPDQVSALLNFIGRGPRWHYHALMRALALTGQGSLIPKGDVGLSIYLEDIPYMEDSNSAPLKDGQVLSSTLLNAIQDQCQYYKRSLMRTHIFNFEGDQGDDFIDVSQCLVDVKPHLKSGHVMTVPIKGADILEQVEGAEVPHTVRLYADPGDGKTTFGKNFVFNWSIDFLNHIVKQGQSLVLKSKRPKSTMMVFLHARDIKTTVEAAIRHQLGCKKKDVDELMAHIEQGEGIVIVIDGFDELRDSAALKKVASYVEECQRRGGPTVIVTCRTDLCSIDARYFDRFVTLKGYTTDEGLQYVKLYTEMSEASQLSKVSQSKQVLQYVMQHKELMKPVLANPLRLHIFCALATRKELDLVNTAHFNIPKLFLPLERYLLRRSGVKVTEQESQAFYRLCIYALLNDVREFPESLLIEFSIVEPYYIFLNKSHRRGYDGDLEAYYFFSHEMLLEYFGGRYIHTLSTQDRLSFLLIICSNKYFRNLQKIILHLLLQEENNEDKLIETMIRVMVLLQPELPRQSESRESAETGSSRWRSEKKPFVREVLNLHDLVKKDVTIGELLQSSTIFVKNAKSILNKIDNAFSKQSNAFRAENWFGNAKESGTFDHVVDCLTACPPKLRNDLVKNTIHCILPGEYGDADDEDEEVSFVYAVGGGMRWVEIQPGIDEIYAWCPEDAAEALTQHASKELHELYGNLTVYTNHYQDLWGQSEAARWTNKEWNKLRKVLERRFTVSTLWVYLHETTPVKGLLSCPWGFDAVNVRNGTAELYNLMTCGVAYSKKGAPELKLWDTNVVYPEGSRLRKLPQVHVWEWKESDMKIELHPTTPVTLTLNCIIEHHSHLSGYGQIVLEEGTAELGDLMACVDRCRHLGLELVLQNTNIALPEHMNTSVEYNVKEGYLEMKLKKWRTWPNQMLLHAPDTTPVTTFLSWFSDHAVKLSECRRLVVVGGTADLEDLATCVTRCIQEGVQVKVKHSSVVVSNRLNLDIVQLHELRNSRAIDSALDGWQKWVTEEGEAYPWQSLVHMISCKVGHGRRADIQAWSYTVYIYAWCPADARIALEQHASKQLKCPKWEALHIHANHYQSQYGQPDGSTCSKDEWNNLLWVVPNDKLSELSITIDTTSSLLELLASLFENSTHLSQCKITVPYGTIGLEDLTNSAVRCRWEALQLSLTFIHVVVPDALRSQTVKLQETMDTCKLICSKPLWVSESGDNINQSELDINIYE